MIDRLIAHKPLAGIPHYKEYMRDDKEYMRDADESGRLDGVPVIGISRHRLSTDGNGVTTLVAFHGCPLRCKYCLNKECWEPEDRFKHYTPQSLYDEVKVDDLYFRATGGGITFGGGEPCLEADFIVEFRRICGQNWKIRVETSLNVNQRLIDKLAPVVDEWIVDIKAERSEAYKEYTGVCRQQMMNNLSYLTLIEGLNIPKSRIHIRIPVIPGFVDEAQAEGTRKIFVDRWKFRNVEVFCYVTDEERRDSILSTGRGKRVCELLKEIRSEVALKNGLNPTERKCAYKGECPGTCPVCEMEAEKLLREVEGKDIFVTDATLVRIEDFDTPGEPDKEPKHPHPLLSTLHRMISLFPTSCMSLLKSLIHKKR